MSIAEVRLDNCRDLFGLIAKLDSNWVTTDDGYSYVIEEIHHIRIERTDYDDLIIQLPEAEHRHVIEFLEELILCCPTLADFRQEIDEDHNIVHEEDGRLSPSELNAGRCWR